MLRAILRAMLHRVSGPLVWGKSLTFYTCTRLCARANDAKIVRSRDAQCNTKELPQRDKSSEVCIKTWSPPASLSFKGQVTEQTTVKWSITTFEIRPWTMKDLNAAIHHNNGNIVLKLQCFKTATIIDISKTVPYSCRAIFRFLYGLRGMGDFL